MEHVKRASPRQRVLKAGRIVLDDWRTIECGVRDLSDTGAKLACPSPVGIPDEFRLLLVSDHTLRPAKVVWRKETSLGISFTGEAKKAPLRKF